MAIGSLGETAIRSVTRGILLSLGKRLQGEEQTHKLHFVSEVEEEGLRASLSSGYCVTSLDGVFAHGTVSRPKSADDLNVSFVEYKMLSGVKALDETRGIAERRGEYEEVRFKLDASKVERDEIYAAFGSSRSGDILLQLIHHLAVSGVGGYYIVSDARAGEVLRVVRVTMDPAMRERHLATLHLIGSYFFPRTFDPGATMKASEEFLFRRRDAVVNGSLSRTSKPLIPLAVYEWNRSKSAVDAMSRTTHNMRLPTSRPGSHRKMIAEVLNIHIHNAVRLTRVLRVLPALDEFSSVEELMREVRGDVSVGQFIRKECVAAMERDRSETEPSTPTRPSSSGGAARGGKSSSRCDPGNEEWRESVSTAIRAIRGSIRKAEAWNTELLREVRLNSVGGTWMNHVVDGVLHGDCQRCGAGDCECASREAPLTSVRCSLCNEFLCTKARPELWGPRRTCWEVFHNDHELPLHPYHDYTPPTGSAVKRARLDPEMNTDGSAVKRARGRAMSMLAGAGSSGTHMSHIEGG